MGIESDDRQMPPGVAEMTTQQLWNWVHRSTANSHWDSAFGLEFWQRMTGMGSHRPPAPSVYTTIALQRDKIFNLKKQIADMNRGYCRKIKKLQAELKALKEAHE